MKTGRYISVNKATMAKLMKIFNVGERCIKNALAYRSDNDLARRIRKAALENCGVEYAVGIDMECFYDADNVMHQLFPNGAELTIDTRSGYGEIVFNGRRVIGFDSVRVRDIPSLQERARNLR